MKHKKAIVAIAVLSAIFAVVILASTVLLLKYKFRQARFAANEVQKVALQQMNQQNEQLLSSSVDESDFPDMNAANANVAILVNNLDVAYEALTGLVQQESGKVVSSDINFASSRVRNGVVIVQVSKSRFTEAVANIKSLGIKVVQENVRESAEIDKEELQSQLEVRTLEDEALSKVIEQAGNANDVITATQRKEEIKEEIRDLESKLDDQKAAEEVGYIRVVLAENKAFSLASGAMMSNIDVDRQMPALDVKQQIVMWVLLGLRVFVTLLLAGLLATGIIIIFRTIFRRRQTRKVIVRSSAKKAPATKRSKVVKRRSL